MKNPQNLYFTLDYYKQTTKLLQELTLRMQSPAQGRKNRMANIRASLQQIPVMKKNSHSIELKMEKKAKRKASLLSETPGGEVAEIDELLQREQKMGSMGKFQQKYQLGDKIGEGSNGLVRKCWLKSSSQLFAVKEITMDQEHIMFLKANFKYIKSLQHPNIIRYHVMYMDNRKKTCNLVMDYDSNPNLLKFTDLSEQEIRDITFQLIGTLEYIHSQNVCHRDIKPENILYDRANRKIKLIDFGISKKIVERGTKKEMLTITGTLYYRAPEMFLGGGYDEKVDLWACGITLYQLLSKGRTPFQSDYLSMTIENIVRGEVQYPEQIWSHYNKFAKDLVSRLLRKNSERLTAFEAKRHFWFEEQQDNEIDITRSDAFRIKSPEKKKKGVFYEDIEFRFERSLTNTFTNNSNSDTKSGGGQKTDKKKGIIMKWLAESDEDVLVDIDSEEEREEDKEEEAYGKKKEKVQN